MENNKYICPNCGSEMLETYEKPALNLSCPKCGCKIATTKWDEIDLDDEIYSVYVDSIDMPNVEQIRFVSRTTGRNFIESKSFLKSGGLIFKGSAVDVLKMKKTLESNSYSFRITPFFKY